jgi:ADP-ribosylglycohydrolase
MRKVNRFYCKAFSLVCLLLSVSTHFARANSKCGAHLLPPLNIGKTVNNTLLGIAVGDAFGVGIEFKTPEWIAQNVDFTKYLNERTGPWGVGYRPGDYSDDTSDSLALIKALLSKDQHGLSKSKLLQALRLEYEASRADRNGLPRAGFGSIKDFFEGRQTLRQVQEAQRGRRYPGNAPPMRAVPIGFLESSKINRLAALNAEVTHPHPKAIAASIVIARAARYLIVERRPASRLISYCLKKIEGIDRETSLYLKAVDRLPEQLSNEDHIFLVGNPKGLGADSMRTAGTALYILKHSNAAFDSLKRAIRMGGDVDSLAAITLGINAGRFGMDDLPKFLLDGLENKQGIEAIAESFSDFINRR